MVGATALPAAAAGQHQGRLHHGVVYISGVRNDGLSRVDHSNSTLNKQWVAVTNGSRRVVNLDHWTLSDAEGHTYTFRHVRLAGRATVRVHTGVGHDSRTDLYQDRRLRVWNHNSDTATLRDDRGRVMDAVSWGVRDHRRDGAGRHEGAGRHHGDHRR
ncbi:lamin tail domain-containing protein [Streptomyces broussonetiae]|uniref:Lamin tail domain-containing protein n=2 Tax=Streptomyces broussonetiae TaxID=2686304 RepID=A0A6I6NFP7_9ACTN|nr:lamin tail domain-containing protein [Streptomyces broussonetiae]QHA10132.1 lamin tail domain-containing protein [Streptomyces broussonetiae]